MKTPNKPTNTLITPINKTPNKPTITIRIRELYGTRRYYPVCEHAHLFATIAGTTTLTPIVLAHIEELGYTIKYDALTQYRVDL